MKKVLALMLMLILVLGFCGCEEVVQKQVEFKHYDIFEQSVVFNIPDEWFYIENIDQKVQTIFKLLDRDYNIVAIGSISSEDVSKNESLTDIILVDSDDECEVSKDVFCAFYDDEKSDDCIYARVKEKLLLISIKGNIEESVTKNIAESISFKEIKVAEQTLTSQSVETSSADDLNTIDLSIFDSAEIIDNKQSIDTIKAVYNTLDRIKPILEKEWMKQMVNFADMYAYAYFSLRCDDGYVYRFVENYTTDSFELWKTSTTEGEIVGQAYEVVYRKALPEDCNVVTTHRDYIVETAPYQIITIAQVEKIIETSNISALYKVDIPLNSYEVSSSKKIFKTEYYVPEALAYFSITEDYSENKAYYSLWNVGHNDEYTLPEYDKYTVYKPLSSKANLENHKRNGLHFDD